MFKIGDRVKCIKVGNITNGPGLNPPLVLNREYIIYDIHVCKCGSVTLDVGLSTTMSNAKCVKCSNKYKGQNVHWCHSSRFIKVQEKTEYKAVHSEIVVEEPVLN